MHLKDRSSQGFNAIRVVTMKWRGADADASGQAAFVGTGEIPVNPEFFERLGCRIDRINGHGLLTATPHKGDPANFCLFLQLLDTDVDGNVTSIREEMQRRHAPFYLRRTKEAMAHFPQRQSDGSWVAKKIFTKRIPETVEFQFDGAEFDLYHAVIRLRAKFKFTMRSMAHACTSLDSDSRSSWDVPCQLSLLRRGKMA